SGWGAATRPPSLPPGTCRCRRAGARGPMRRWARAGGGPAGSRKSPSRDDEGPHAMSTPEVIIHRDASLLAKAAAARLVTRLVDAVTAHGSASLVLTGGGIGTAVLSELAATPARDA